MIRGLQITIRGEELSIRMAERIRMHEAAIDALGARIKERAGDQPFDVRAEDGFKSLGELETEYQQYGDRVTHLMLLRDNLVPDELYTLSKSDLRMAELISPDFKEVSDSDPRVWLDNADEKAIDGLKVTIPGLELRKLLGQRAKDHREHAERWRNERARTPEQQTEDEPLLPEHMCEHEAERHDWRAAVLDFIRRYIESYQTYRLGPEDLTFGELLPEKPGSVEQQEYEERTRVGFHLERVAKRLCALTPRQISLELADAQRAE